MSESTVRIRLMLQGYEQQLLAARRLAKFRDKYRSMQGEHIGDPDPAPNRRRYVEKVTQEVFQCLLYTGDYRPIIEEIRAELSSRMGLDLRFTYPPGKRLCVIKMTEKGAAPLDPEEKQKVRILLFKVTHEKINSSMLEEDVRNSSLEIL
ncbi:MAG: hypothetical protein IJT59_05485 [Desulfovibrionaceae bacterium]|nr:hypothetical protein [Desulfovibrionaceae bacterium]